MLDFSERISNSLHYDYTVRQGKVFFILWLYFRYLMNFQYEMALSDIFQMILLESEPKTLWDLIVSDLAFMPVALSLRQRILAQLSASQKKKNIFNLSEGKQLSTWVLSWECTHVSQVFE